MALLRTWSTLSPAELCPLRAAFAACCSPRGVHLAVYSATLEVVWCNHMFARELLTISYQLS